MPRLPYIECVDLDATVAQLTLASIDHNEATDAPSGSGNPIDSGSNEMEPIEDHNLDAFLMKTNLKNSNTELNIILIVI